MPSRFRSIARRLAYCLLAVAALALLFWVFHAPILTGLANAWIVNDPPRKADAIVVLGGRPDLRPLAAAELYHRGYAPKILYMNVELSPSAELGIDLSEAEITRRLLRSNDVPAAALEAIGTNVSSTYDEALATSAWARANRPKALLIPTDLFHTRRVRWLFTKELRQAFTGVHVLAVPLKQYGITNWWQREQGLIDFQNETLKSVYYWLNYGPLRSRSGA